VVVGGECAHDRLAGVVVVPDGGGEREDALQDADHHSAGGAAVVSLEIELALESLIDRIDDLPQWLEQLRSGPLGLALAGRPQQPDAQFGHLLLELAAEVVLVADQCLARALGGELRLDREKVQQRLALVGLGSGQRESDGQAFSRSSVVT
jgi:hypothetical protein